MSPGTRAYDKDIDRRAAEWFGRREVGLSSQQEKEFQSWLEADERHAVHYRQFDDTWDLLDGLKALNDRAPVKLNNWSTFPSWGRWVTVALAAAAAIAVAFTLWPRFGQSPNSTHIAETQAGGMKMMELPDGSVVHLNADSFVSVQYSPKERRVVLSRGEAHFAVATNPDRPFIVTAGAVSVHAVGTAFNVRIDPGAVEVMVTEGKVRVDDSAKGQSLLAPDANELTGSAHPGSQLLIAGEKVSIPVVANIPAPAVPAAISPEQIDLSLAWQTKMLEFDMTPLGDVVQVFNLHNTHQLVILDQALARRPFGGTFRADNYSVFVQLLEQRFGVVAERSGDRTVLKSGN